MLSTRVIVNNRWIVCSSSYNTNIKIVYLNWKWQARRFFSFIILSWWGHLIWFPPGAWFDKCRQVGILTIICIDNVGCGLGVRTVGSVTVQPPLPGLGTSSHIAPSPRPCCLQCSAWARNEGCWWAFSWLKAPFSAFTFKTLLRHYAKRTLTPRYVDVK